MQTERVTFLTSRDHKAALDAYAAQSGQSVGHVLREASTRYIAGGEDDEAELAALVEEANAAIPRMIASLDRMSERLQATNRKIDGILRDAGIRP